MIIPWTDEEDAILASIWDTVESNPLAVAATHLPNRSKGAIQVRASQKGHSKRRMERLGLPPVQRRPRAANAPQTPSLGASRAVLRPIPLVNGDRERIRLRLVRTMEALASELRVTLKSVIATARVLSEDSFKADKELALEAAASGEVALGAPLYFRA